MSDTADKELEAIAAGGMDVEAFMRSTVGRYVLNRAQEEIEEARTQLEAVDPEDPKAIRDLQFVIAVARATTSWLSEAVAEGKNAEEQLAAREHTD